MPSSSGRRLRRGYFLRLWAALSVAWALGYFFWTLTQCKFVDHYSYFADIREVCGGNSYTSEMFWVGAVAVPTLGVPILILIFGGLTVRVWVPWAEWAILLASGHIGTGLQRGLARFWIAASVGWLAHSVWWTAAHCSQANPPGSGFSCATGTEHLTRFQSSDFWEYVATTPLALLAATFAAYWVIRGFRPRWAG
jgi:hypothetical protein